MPGGRPRDAQAPIRTDLPAATLVQPHRGGSLKERHLDKPARLRTEDVMGEIIDKTKGKAKEAVGKVTGDRKLEAKGKADQVKGKIKGKFEALKQGVKKALQPKK